MSNKLLSENNNNLIKTQNKFFPIIIIELNKYNEKTSHWNWYVFPYNEIGPSDTKKTRLDDDNKNILDYLKNCDFNKWITILELIFNIIKTKNIGWVGCMPEIDHFRMSKSIVFWLDKFNNNKNNNKKLFEPYNKLKTIFENIRNYKSIKHLVSKKVTLNTSHTTPNPKPKNTTPIPKPNTNTIKRLFISYCYN